MQVPGEEDVARHESLKRRAEEHALWKRSFFQSRPPPPFIPKYRRHREPIASAPVHSFYKRALELVAAEEERPTSSPRPLTPVVGELKGQMHKRDAWVQQMALEMDRRNPYTDVRISTDPRRTVVISGLHSKSVEEDIRLFGEQFGHVVSVRLICDHKGKSRRYAFVQFRLEAEARKAVGNSRRRRLHGHAVVMEMERGRLELDFLPKRMAEARRHCETPSLLLKRKRQCNEQPVKCPKTDATVPSLSVTVGGSCDEVDAFLDDIMNLT